MQIYNGRQFKKDNLTIPNLPSNYRLEMLREEDGYTGTNKFFKLFKDGIEMLEFAYGGYDQRLSIRTINYRGMQEDGSEITEAMHRTTAGHIYLDDLYYTYNPVNLRQRDGKVFAKTFIGLRQRLSDGREYTICKFTQKAIRYVSEHIKKTISHTHPDVRQDSPEFHKLCNEALTMSREGCLAFHSVTGEIIARPHMVRGRGGVIFLKVGDSPDQYGYRAETVRYEHYWLKADEFLIDGGVVSLADGSEVCPDCGTTVPIGYMTTDEDDGHRTCKKCASTTYEIQSYSTRAPQVLSFKAKKVTPSTIYLGCELEYETSNKDVARRKVGKALKGHAIMKSDGSINNGFEVVTCPATLEIQLEVFKKFFENRPAELKIAANVGMHVHVSRAPLSVLTVGKMTEFMNRADNVKFITHIAGRSPNTYCKQEYNRSLSFPLVYKTGERYNTLNLNNEDTVEFRIFSTPLTYEEFAHKVQFCQALTDYCKPGVLSEPLKVQTSHTNFISWVLGHHKDYPELTAKIKSFSA